MTVAELIAELQRMPNQNARVVRLVEVRTRQDGHMAGWRITRDEQDLISVRNEGPFVSVELR